MGQGSAGVRKVEGRSGHKVTCAKEANAKGQCSSAVGASSARDLSGPSRPQGQQVKMIVWIYPDRRAWRVPRQLVSPQSLGPGPVQSRWQVSRTCRALLGSCADCRESSPAHICSTQHGKAEDGRGPRRRGPGDLVLHRAADAYTPGSDAAAIMLEIVRLSVCLSAAAFMPEIVRTCRVAVPYHSARAE